MALDVNTHGQRRDVRRVGQHVDRERRCDAADSLSADTEGVRAKLHVAPTLMTTLEDRERLARTVLGFADSLT